jgi:hypothetical protein
MLIMSPSPVQYSTSAWIAIYLSLQLNSEHMHFSSGAIVEGSPVRLPAGIASVRRGNTKWMFDKSLNTWHCFPAVAAVMPGAVFFYIMREP